MLFEAIVDALGSWLIDFQTWDLGGMAQPGDQNSNLKLSSYRNSNKEEATHGRIAADQKGEGRG
jgi:hypothetical protein